MVFLLTSRRTGRDVGSIDFDDVPGGFPVRSIADPEMDIFLFQTEHFDDHAVPLEGPGSSQVFMVPRDDDFFTYVIDPGDDYKEGDIEQKTFDALKKAFIPTINVKEYRSSRAGLVVDRARTAWAMNEYRSEIESRTGKRLNYPTLAPKLPEWIDESKLEKLTHFFSIPARMSYFVDRRLQDTLTGKFYVPVPREFPRGHIGEKIITRWTAEAEHINVVADLEGMVHSIDGHCDMYEHSSADSLSGFDGIILELDRWGLDIFLRKGFYLPEGYRYFEGYMPSELDEDLLLKPCPECSQGYIEGRYER